MINAAGILVRFDQEQAKGELGEHKQISRTCIFAILVMFCLLLSRVNAWFINSLRNLHIELLEMKMSHLYIYIQISM